MYNPENNVFEIVIKGRLEMKAGCFIPYPVNRLTARPEPVQPANRIHFALQLAARIKAASSVVQQLLLNHPAGQADRGDNQ